MSKGGKRRRREGDEEIITPFRLGGEKQAPTRIQHKPASSEVNPTNQRWAESRRPSGRQKADYKSKNPPQSIQIHTRTLLETHPGPAKSLPTARERSRCVMWGQELSSGGGGGGTTSEMDTSCGAAKHAHKVIPQLEERLQPTHSRRRHLMLSGSWNVRV